MLVCRKRDASVERLTVDRQVDRNNKLEREYEILRREAEASALCSSRTAEMLVNQLDMNHWLLR